MIKATYNLGLEFCDDVLAFAPRTRSKALKPIDLTAASLEVCGARLRSSIEWVFAGRPWSDARTIEESAERILLILTEWTRGERPPEMVAAAHLVCERGELFLSLMRREDRDRASMRGV